MSKRRLFLSIQRLKIHELRSTVRIVLGEEINFPKQSKIYSKLETQAIQSFVKILSTVILGYLIGSSLRVENDIGLAIGSIRVFAPASYFLFFLSVSFLINAIAFNHLSTAMVAKARLAWLIRIPGFSIGAYDVLQSHSQNGLGAPNHVSLFHKEVLPIQGILQFLFIAVLLATLLPLFALGSFLFNEQVLLATNTSISIVERLTAVMGLVSTMTAGIFVIFFHLPLPVKKNKQYIRWNFLYLLPPHSSDTEKFQRWHKDRQ